MCNTCLGFGGRRIICGRLVTSFLSAHVSKLGVNEGYIGGNMVGLSGGDTDAVALVQKYVMCNDKEPV